MKHSKKLEQRTFLQDRFEILIKKQKSGKATFNELTELDEIVNRNAVIRDRILEEMQGFNESSDDMMIKEVTSSSEVKKQSQSIFTIIKSFVGRLFILKSSHSALFLYSRKVCLSF